MLKILLGLSISLSAFGFTGFTPDNVFSTSQYVGSTTVNCQGQTQTYNCRGYTYSPGTHAYFYADEEVDANKLNLVSVSDQGTRKKSVKYSAERRRSKSNINMLINTVTQTSLLRPGKNLVSYQLLKDNEVLASGEFTAEYVKGQSFSCRHRSQSMAQCPISDVEACNNYFRSNPVCN